MLGARWQHEIRELVGATQPSEANYILVVLVTVPLTLGLLMAARIRWVVRLIARLVGRLVPDRAAAATLVLVICVVILLLLTGALSRGVLGLANSVFSGVDSGTAAGVTEPASALRSGSQCSTRYTRSGTGCPPAIARSRAWCTCRTPPTRSCGGPGRWPSTSQAG